MQLRQNSSPFGTWTFLSNHAHVLICLAQDPELRIRDLALRVGITERGAQRILSELSAEGYVSKQRVGRRNRYVIHPHLPLRHPIERQHEVGTLLGLLRLMPASGIHSRARRVANQGPN